jgi:nitroreductase
MDVLDAITHRRAIRDFTREPVHRPTVEALVRAAVHAPSAMNLQPWAFVVIDGRDTLARLSADAKAHLLKAMAPGSPLARYRERLGDPSFDIFYNAPALVIVCATSGELWATEDCALAAQNLMLAAHAQGLGTCWIGFARPWLNEPQAKSRIGIPPHYAPVPPLVLGHPAAAAEPTSRRDPEIVWATGTSRA